MAATQKMLPRLPPCVLYMSKSLPPVGNFSALICIVHVLPRHSHSFVTLSPLTTPSHTLSSLSWSTSLTSSRIVPATASSNSRQDRAHSTHRTRSSRLVEAVSQPPNKASAHQTPQPGVSLILPLAGLSHAGTIYALATVSQALCDGGMSS